ncbi:MAG TPA: hypothetical protein VGL13_04255, partial [Polyangiaceae bacterium]
MSLGIAGQFCEESGDPDWVGNEVVQLRMKIAVENRGQDPIRVRADRWRVLTPDGIVAQPVDADEPMVV